MIGSEDIASYLIRTELDFEEVEEGVWMVRIPPGEDGTRAPPIMVSYVPPVLFLRAGMREVPDEEDARLRLFQRLLELNADDLVHGAYGLEDGEVVLADTLELENLDFTEFRASLESLTMAVTAHGPELAVD